MQVILQLETLSRAGDRHLPCNNTYHNYSSSAAVAADRNCWHLALFMSYYFVVFAAFRRSNHGDARPRGGRVSAGEHTKGDCLVVFLGARWTEMKLLRSRKMQMHEHYQPHTYTGHSEHTHTHKGYVQVLFIYRIYAHIYAEIQYIMPYVEELQI